MDDFRWLWRYLRPQAKWILAALAGAALISPIPGVMAWMVRPFMDGVVIQKDASSLGRIVLILVGLSVVKAILTYFFSYTLNASGLNLVTKIRDDMSSHYQRSSISFFDRNMSGELLSRVSYDVSLIERVIPALVDLIGSPLAIVWLLGVAFWQDARITALALLVFPAVGFGLYAAARKIKARSGAIQSRMGDFLSMLEETLVGARIVKAFDREAFEVERIRGRNEEVLHSGLRVLKISVLTSPVAEFLGTVSFVLALSYGAWRVIHGETTPGAFTSCITALALVYQPLKKASRLNTVFPPALSAAERIQRLLTRAPEVQERPEPLRKTSFESEVRFENVSFRYGKEWALREFQLTLRKGEVVALAGPSGGGKSTVANLLLRFYDPTFGSVRIDGVDARDLAFSSLRGLAALVTQETFLFNDTVEANIAYGRPGCSRADVEAAARMAQAHDFVLKLSHGYETVVGERGTKLSGGERQRIAIARALVRNAPILILDEATSNLDLEAEAEIQRILSDAMKGKTVLMIAHRLHSIQHVDRIIVMDRGRIDETGTHEELLALQGSYSRLFRSQASDPDRLRLVTST